MRCSAPVFSRRSNLSPGSKEIASLTCTAPQAVLCGARVARNDADKASCCKATFPNLSNSDKLSQELHTPEGI